MPRTVRMRGATAESAGPWFAAALPEGAVKEG